MARRSFWAALLMLPALLFSIPEARSAAQADAAPITLQTQGSFLAGGKTATHPGVYDSTDNRNPQGQTVYGDHAYVFYQIPVNAKKLPLVFLHGGGQSSRT